MVDSLSIFKIKFDKKLKNKLMPDNFYMHLIKVENHYKTKELSKKNK